MEKFLVKAIHKTGKYIEELVESNNPNKVKLQYQGRGYTNILVEKKSGISGNLVLTPHIFERKYNMKKTAIELFAGVGGFRVGLNDVTLKGSKKIERVSKDGFKYTYSEGKMNYPDSLELPGRTMLTSEGTVNRSSHVVLDRNAATKRFLTPIECERLNQFPDNWTNTMPIRNRYFMMGNSLVTGIVSKLGKIISEYIDEEE